MAVDLLSSEQERRFILDQSEADSMAKLLRLARHLSRAESVSLIAITEPQFPAQQDDWMYFDERARIAVQPVRESFAFTATSVDESTGRLRELPALEFRVRVLRSDRTLPARFWPLRVQRSGADEIMFDDFDVRDDTFASPGSIAAGERQPVTLRDGPNRLVRGDIVTIRSEFGYSYEKRGAIFDDDSQGVNLIAQKPDGENGKRAFASIAFLGFAEPAAETDAEKLYPDMLRYNVSNDEDLRHVLDIVLRQ
jgi:hypothetical protein